MPFDKETKDIDETLLQFIKNILVAKQWSYLSVGRIKRIQPGTKISDVLDELDFVEMVIDIEKQQLINIPDEKMMRFKTFQDLITEMLNQIQNR